MHVKSLLTGLPGIPRAVLSVWESGKGRAACQHLSEQGCLEGVGWGFSHKFEQQGMHWGSCTEPVGVCFSNKGVPQPQNASILQ